MELSNLILLGLLLCIKEVSSLRTIHVPHSRRYWDDGEGGDGHHETALLNCDDTYQVNEPSRMLPLSCPPLLLLQSSTPLIGKDACSLLCNYFDEMNGNDYKTTKNMDSNQKNIAETLLDDIHYVIDKVTNSPRHDGESVPRYVRYESNAIDEDLLLDQTKFGKVLLPDGLHVDTNNGKLFRHITAILYLTDNKDELSDENGFLRVGGGGTSFPLATPIDKRRVYEHNNLQHVAQRLLSRNLEHTKGDAYETPTSEGRTLEMAGLNVFYRDNIRYLSQLQRKRDNQLIATHHSAATNNLDGPGVRVMPEAGKLIYFHNMNDKGYPDPISFHGGEELITIKQQENDNNVDRSSIADTISKTTKSILVFFKEIPVHAFSSKGRDGFAAEVEKSRQWTKKMYY